MARSPDQPGALAWIAGHPVRVVLGAAGCALATLAAVIAIGLVLVLSGKVDLTAAGTADAYVFVSTSANEKETAALRDALASENGVVAVRFVTRDASLAALSQRFGALGATDPLADLKSNPLPDAYVATFRPGTESQRVAEATNGWRKLARVDSVQVDVDGYRTRESLRQLGLPLLGLAALLALIGWLVALGTAAGAVATIDPAEVRALRLVGADEAFIRGPMTRAGLALGAVGGMIAGVVLIAVSRSLAPAIAAIAANLGVDPLPLLEAAPLEVAAGVALLALLTALAGALAAMLCARIRLRQIEGP